MSAPEESLFYCQHCGVGMTLSNGGSCDECSDLLALANRFRGMVNDGKTGLRLTDVELTRRRDLADSRWKERHP
jgi:hypothetical protein